MRHGDRFSDDYEDRFEWHMSRIRQLLCVLLAVMVASQLVLLWLEIRG